MQPPGPLPVVDILVAVTQISGSDQDPQRLVGKVVVVTGAARGQGAAEAAALARAGATVIGTDVRPEGSECRAAGCQS